METLSPPPLQMPVTKVQPRKAITRAASFFLVNLSLKKMVDMMTTKVGAVYSRMAAMAREDTCWLLK